MTLAQVGQYQGASSIEEYVKFADVDSPYIADHETLTSKTFFKSRDNSLKMCTFITYATVKVEVNTDFSPNDGTYLVGRLVQTTFDFSGS